jgi:hypothetical protein
MTVWFTETGFGYLIGVAAVPLIGLLLVCHAGGDALAQRVILCVHARP